MRPGDLPESIFYKRTTSSVMRKFTFTILAVLALAFGLNWAHGQTPTPKSENPIKKAASDTGETVKKGTKATARTVGKGIENTGKAIKKAGATATPKRRPHHKKSPSGSPSASPSPSTTPPPSATPVPNPTPQPETTPRPTPGT